MSRVAVLLTLGLLTACSSPAPAPSSSAASPSAVVALCQSGTPTAPDVSAIRSKYPKLTDDRAAYAMALLPADIATSAGIADVVSGTPTTQTSTSLDSGVVTIRSGTTTAPAELAAAVMFVLTAKVIAESNKTPTASDIELLAQAVAAISADTYLKLAQTKPESTWGTHAPGESTIDIARKRLARSAGVLTGTNEDRFASHPAYWESVSRFLGEPYYRHSPAGAGFLNLQPPVASGDVAALTSRLSGC